MAAAPHALSLQDDIETFLETCESEHTRRAYARHLQGAFAYLPVGSVHQLESSHLAGYRAQLVRDGRGSQTHAQALSALRRFLSWARLHRDYELSAEVVGDALKSPKAKVQKPYAVVNRKEGAALLQLDDARDRALFAVMLGGGLRVSEVVGLRLSDITEDDEGGAILRVRGKGKKERLVPMSDVLLRWVDEYLEETERERGKGRRGPLFLSGHRGFSDKAITPAGVRHVLKKAAASVGITGKSVSPHSLRHSFAIWALREGASVKHVQKFLGHSSIETTNRYLDHLELGELREALPRLPK